MTYSQPLILITNDDGIHSDGINLLQKIIKKYSSNLLVIAPNKNNSGAGHSITLSRPIRIKNIKNNMYSCDGTPTDCVLIGIKEVLKGKKPDLIISGINEGANLGDDLTYSGTVCAAMEGALLGINSLALSLEIRNKSMI